MVLGTKKIYFGESAVVMVSYLVHHDTLLQNVTDNTTKCDSCFITKCDKSLLQNVAGFLLRNATVLLQNTAVLQNTSILLLNATVITKCNVYYKMRRYDG